jgi:hypothetical protein
MKTVGEKISVLLGDGFVAPAWREGIICEKGVDNLYVIAVLLQAAEEPEEDMGTQLKVEDRRYLLVEASSAQMREEMPEGTLRFEGVTRSILRAFYQIGDGDLSCGSVSDPPQASKDAKDLKIKSLEAQVKQLKEMMEKHLLGGEGGEVADDGGSSFQDVQEIEADDELKDEPLLKLLQARKKNMSEEATKADSSERKRLRDILGQHGGAAGPKPPSVAKKFLADEEEEKKPVQGDLLEMLLKDKKDIDSGTLQALINREILELLKNQKGKAKASTATLDDSSEDEGKDMKLKGVAKSIKNYQDHKKAMYKQPVKYVRSYVKECREEIGADEGQSWNILDMTKRIGYSDSHRNLHRFDWMLRNVLKLQLEDKSDEAALLVVLCLRCVRQVKIDGGSWRVGWLLTHLRDPIFPLKFAGAEQELELIAAYTKAVEELEKKTKKPEKTEKEE